MTADRDKADAEAQRLRDEGHEVVEIGWSPGETIERDGKAFSLPQYGGDGRADDDCLDGEVAPPAVLIEHMLEVEPAPEPAAVRPA